MRSREANGSPPWDWAPCSRSRSAPYLGCQRPRPDDRAVLRHAGADLRQRGLLGPMVAPEPTARPCDTIKCVTWPERRRLLLDHQQAARGRVNTDLDRTRERREGHDRLTGSERGQAIPEALRDAAD